MATVENKGRAQTRLLNGNRVFYAFSSWWGAASTCWRTLLGAVDDAGDEIDPVLREVVAVAPLGVGVNAVGVLHVDGVDGQLVEGRTTGIGVWRDDIEPVNEAGIELRIELLPEVVASVLNMFVGLAPPWGMWMSANGTRPWRLR
jgi:hypothetical protein